ncbi:LysE type translocator [Adhaeretor mobilis]|uniref:LysE type translocator n=2 Tax=Adhaeretor mobilis TaxID=1930276 RepID=A0A517MQ66_9BACT|nr:LysE type translocator [Adhaeretor mobilis]
MLSPGPAGLASFLLATRYRVSQLVPFQLGIVLVYAVVAIAIGLLTEQISGLSPLAIRVLQFVGGLFIIYLGVQLARRTQHVTKQYSPTLLNGVMLQCLNPKFPGVVLAVFANRNSQSTLETAAIISLVGAIGLLIYSAAGALLRFRQATEKRLRAVDVLSGALLCAVGCWFVLRALLDG